MIVLTLDSGRDELPVTLAFFGLGGWMSISLTPFSGCRT